MATPIPMSIGPHGLEGELCLADPPGGIVVFAHGSGSSRRSDRNRHVAEALQREGLGTLLFDLLTEKEATDRSNVFDIPLLAQRITEAIDALHVEHGQPIGLFGASTGGGAALFAAARRPQAVRAVVVRGGRPDLAGDALRCVKPPSLLIVGGADTEVLALNRAAFAQLQCEKQLEIVPGAAHLFAEPGALQAVARLASAWFVRHLRGGLTS